MKRLTIAGLALVGLASLAPVANAEPSPAQLANLARNGYLTEQGIPSFAVLGTAHQMGRITAEDVIQAAIEDGRLAPEFATQRFEAALEQSLTDLDGRRN